MITELPDKLYMHNLESDRRELFDVYRIYCTYGIFSYVRIFLTLLDLSYNVRLILTKCKWNLESVCRFENSSVRTEYTE